MKKILLILLIIVFGCKNLSPEEKKQLELEKRERQSEIKRKQDSITTKLAKERKARDSIRSFKRDSIKKAKNINYNNAFSKLKVDSDKSKGISYYRSKKLKHYINSNKISAYIIRDQYDNLTLRFKVSYYSKNSRWIFFDKFALFYDGQLFEKSFNPTLRETGVNEFEVWEYIDIVANEEMDMHLEGVSNSKDASIILEGIKSDDRKITTLEKKALNDVISAYYKATLF